ncbi:urease accessory protein UreD [Salinigranum sp. GCM10025319]|uniref:urease accessory protein UreD n=1 Tax=Salinigranum sp. GCM10025319 TaxID=3252687 RepID=UPI0036205FBA
MATTTPAGGDEGRTPPGFEAYAAESLAQSPAGAVGKGGELDLRFSRGSDGQSRLVYDRATVPFHLTGGLAHDEALPEIASAYVQDPTGGIAQGDRYEASIEVEADARAHVSTGSATKVLRMERNYGSSHLSIRVDDGGYLEYLPDPTILHRDARFWQSIEIDLGRDSAVLLADVVVPGRLARDEAFAFDRLHASVEARSSEGELFADALALDGGDHLRGPGLFGEFRVLGTFYVVAPDHDDVETLADDLHACVQDDDGAEEPPAVGGASVLPRESGVAVRVLGDRSSDVTDRFARVWDRARRELVGAGAPDTRKF